MTQNEILQKYDEAVSSFAAGLAAGLLDADQEKAFKEQYELFRAGRDALRRSADFDKLADECESLKDELMELTTPDKFERRKLERIAELAANHGGIDHLVALDEAARGGRLMELPFVAMVEQSLQGGKMKPERDQRFNGRYAVVYSGKGKWGCPLIDICGTPYNRDQAEEQIIFVRERTNND